MSDELIHGHITAGLAASTDAYRGIWHALIGIFCVHWKKERGRGQIKRWRNLSIRTLLFLCTKCELWWTMCSGFHSIWGQSTTFREQADNKMEDIDKTKERWRKVVRSDLLFFLNEWYWNHFCVCNLYIKWMKITVNLVQMPSPYFVLKFFVMSASESVQDTDSQNTLWHTNMATADSNHLLQTLFHSSSPILITHTWTQFLHSHSHSTKGQ